MCRLIFTIIISCATFNAFNLLTSRPTIAQTLDQCTNLDAAGVRERLNSLIAQSIDGRFRSIDIDALVKASWERQRVSEKLDLLADRIVDDLQKQKSYWERFWSNYSTETASNYANEVTSRYFNSREFQEITNGLVESAGDEIAKQLSTHLSETSELAIRCFGEFLKGSYSGVLKRGIEDHVSDGVIRKLASGLESGGPRVGTSGKLITSLGLLGVAAALSRQAVRRIVTNLLTRLAQRVAGRVAAGVAFRIGAIFSGLGTWLALGMLVWELVSGASGVFPQIRDELKSQKVKDELKVTFSSEFKDLLSTQAPVLSRDLSGAITASWEQFKSRYRALLETAEKVPEFKAWLGRQPEDSFNGVARTVDVIVRYRHEAGLVEAIRSGLLDRVAGLPEEAFVIIEGSQSLDQALGWVDKFPDRLKRIVALEIYRYVSPSAVTREVLLRVLAADDKIVARRLLSLSAESRDGMLLLPDPLPVDLSVRLDATLLEGLGPYWRLLDADQRIMLARAIIATPSVANIFMRSVIRSIIADAPNRREAIEFFAQTGGLLSIYRFATEVVGVVDSSVPMYWFYAKYERAFWLAGGVLAIILFWPLLLRRLFGFGRPRAIVQTRASGR
jgi:hypothetical protein